MEPEPRAPDDERAARLARVDAMRARGEDPYPVRFDRTHTLGEVRDHWDDRVEPGTTTIFKSLGMAVEDVAAARLVYDAANK